MGVRGLKKLLIGARPGPADRRARLVAVDASPFIYGWYNVPLTNEDGARINHLLGMAQAVLRARRRGDILLFVFDGAPPAAKRARAVKADGAGPTRADFAECKKLLTLLGCPWVQAEGEADPLCAALAKAGRVDIVASPDMDLLAFGAPLVMTKLVGGIVYSLAENLAHLGLTYSQFVDLCVMLGTDYAPKLGGVGPEQTLRLVQAGARSHSPEACRIFRQKTAVPRGVEVAYGRVAVARLARFFAAHKMFGPRIDGVMAAARDLDGKDPAS